MIWCAKPLKPGVSLFAFFAALQAACVTANASGVTMAPLLGSEGAALNHYAYNVVFKSNASAQAVKEHRDWVQKAHLEEQSLSQYSADGQKPLTGLDSVFAIGEDDDDKDESVDYSSKGPVLRAYAGEFGPKTLEKIRQSEIVSYVQRQHVGKFLRQLDEKRAWGLGRISHREHAGLNNVGQVKRSNSSGFGAVAYVLDGGVYLEHEEFEGRATRGNFSVLATGDTKGHGSHVAGIIAGKTFGVANRAEIVDVKVSGPNRGGVDNISVRGIGYVIKDVRRRRQEAKEDGGKPFKGAVINMSLGWAPNQLLDDAVAIATIGHGIHFVVAAGNEDEDACLSSPARSPFAVTVMSSGFHDVLAISSNFGKCADLAAPGVRVRSVGLRSPSESVLKSGTSMASPHVAGIVADLMSQSDREIPTEDMKEILVKLATKDALTIDVQKLLKPGPDFTLIEYGTPNLIAYNGDLVDALS